MAAIRRSGGVAGFYWQGKLPDPGGAPFAEALAERRFRTIEHAATEEVSVGWVTPKDPTGDSFAAEDLDGGAGTWLRMRVDKKTLPKKWLAIHRDAAEKARGRKLSARERRELKDDLTEKLLPRVLPTVNLVDALLFHDRKTVLLFASGRAVREAFGKLFLETFAVPLERESPFTCAQRARLGAEANAALERLEPMRWPQGGAREFAPPARRRAGAPVRATEEDA
ncbi:MAG: recombination-associated protein RdgC [Planctomycetes bacterium]|nr:recombination-associated protein RdgC [Planctomycetota bacterium]